MPSPSEATSVAADWPKIASQRNSTSVRNRNQALRSATVKTDRSRSLMPGPSRRRDGAQSEFDGRGLVAREAAWHKPRDNPGPIPMTRVAAFLSVAAVLLGLGLGWFYVSRPSGGDEFADCRRGAVAGGAASIGGPFALTDGSGARVEETDAITGPTLLYFGYTFCPDFCPNDLARNGAVADLLAERGLDVGLVFATIDPERDTPRIASDFARKIHPRMIGLGGSPEDVAAAAEAYRVYYRKASDDPDFYLMDHSTFTYLVAPGHPFLEFYPTGASAAEVADSVACYAEAL